MKVTQARINGGQSGLSPKRGPPPEPLGKNFQKILYFAA